MAYRDNPDETRPSGPRTPSQVTAYRENPDETRPSAPRTPSQLKLGALWYNSSLYYSVKLLLAEPESFKHLQYIIAFMIRIMVGDLAPSLGEGKSSRTNFSNDLLLEKNSILTPKISNGFF